MSKSQLCPIIGASVGNGVAVGSAVGLAVGVGFVGSSVGGGDGGVTESAQYNTSFTFGDQVTLLEAIEPISRELKSAESMDIFSIIYPFSPESSLNINLAVPFVKSREILILQFEELLLVILGEPKTVPDEIFVFAPVPE